MSVGAESLVTDGWVASRLADAALLALVPGGVHEHPAPLDAPYPFVTWQVFGSPTIVGGIGPGSRIMVKAMYQVQATAEWSAGLFIPIVKRLTVLLDGVTNVAIAGPHPGEVLSCVQREDHRMEEDIDGRVVRHAGGIFEVEAITV